MSTTIEKAQDTSPRGLLAAAIKREMPTLKAIAAATVDPAKIARMALVCAEDNELLYRCTPTSIVRSLQRLAEVGLEPGSAMNQAYIVPYSIKGEWVAQAQVSAYGFQELAYRSGKVKAIWWDAVYQGDEFRVEKGTEPSIVHRPSLEGRETVENLTHVYAVCELESGARVFEVLSRVQIDKLKNANPSVKKGNFSPWTDWYEQMACAKVLKRLCKKLPKSREVAQAMHMDDMAEAGKPEAMDVEFADLNGNKSLGVEAVAEKLGVKKASELNGKTENLAGEGYDHLADYCDEERLAEVQEAIGDRPLEEFGAYCLKKKVIDPDLILLEARKWK